jgi:hypothetical protein
VNTAMRGDGQSSEMYRGPKVNFASTGYCRRFFSSLLLLLFITATHAYSQTVTFSGRVTDTNTGLGIPDVAVVAVGNQTGTRVALTNTNGDYTIEMGTNTNIKMRAYRRNFSFNPVFAGFTSIGGPLTGSHPLNFSGTTLPFAILIFAQAPVLLTEDSSLHALALDSLFLIRDPFPVVNTNYFGSDKHTRIKLMLVDLDLFNGETVSIISVQGIDNSAIVHPAIGFLDGLVHVITIRRIADRD